MAAADTFTLSKISYCCREGFYRQLQHVCNEGLQKFGNDPILVFWKAYALLMEGQVSAAITDFESIVEKPDVMICSIMALIVAHKRAQVIDKEQTKRLETRLKTERGQCGELALYYAGMFLFHSGKVDKAREYIDRMLKMNPQSKDGMILKGWIDLKSTKEQYIKRSLKYFDDVLSGQETLKEIDGMLGKIEYLKMRNNFSTALEMANELVVQYSEFTPALIEKMRLQLALQDWEQSLETANRILKSYPNNIEALRVVTLHTLCKESKPNEAADRIGEICDAVDQLEPQNSYLYYTISKGFARMCGRNQNVLKQTMKLVLKSKLLSPGSADYLNEIAHQLLLQGNINDSHDTYRAAMKLDQSSVTALTGIIHCQIFMGQLEEAGQQLEFLHEIQQSTGTTADILFLNAFLAHKKEKGTDAVLEPLQEAVDMHFQSLSGLPLGEHYLESLNPDFLLQAIDIFFKYAPIEPPASGNQVNSPALRQCLTILVPIIKAIPGQIAALYYIAKAKYISGDSEGAKRAIYACLEQDTAHANAHLLMAQIHLQQEEFSSCERSLENGLSYNFKVRESPLYHIIKARTSKKQGNIDEALKTLQGALNLPGIKHAPKKGNQSDSDVNTSDRATIYLDLADAQRLMGFFPEATKTMQDALNEFQGTAEEIRINIANADFALARGDVEQAITMLRQVDSQQSYYVQAREKMAQIYLTIRKDKKLYTGIYRELVDKNPTPQTYILLGDAYMSIQEPERAIEVYETALKKNPKDSILASKIGQCLVKTHQYGKAINYYEAAVKTGAQAFLRYDLAELYMKLMNYEKADKILKQALQNDNNSANLTTMIEEAKYYLLLARVYQKSKQDPEEASVMFSKARDVQSRVIKRVAVDQADTIAEQKSFGARICCEWAEHYIAQKDFEKAMKTYKEGLFYSEKDIPAMLALSKLYLDTNDLDSCHSQLSTVLKLEKDREEGIVMMADLLFRKNDHEAALYHFQQILDKKPDHYGALSKLIDLMRRAGKLSECSKTIAKCEKTVIRSANDAGFSYCKATFEWYSGNATAALKLFNLSRKDSVWGDRALRHMIEICLNPDSEIVGGEAFETMDNDSGSSTEKHDSEQMALRTAEKLLKEMKAKSKSVEYKILECSALIATKNKPLVEKALSKCMEIATNERDHVPALLCMATAYMVLKQTPRARNQLKRVSKMLWNAEYAEEFEQSWLLLADIYIQNGKYDMSQELLKRCLKHNKSCCKAWEYMGFIMEKEQSYKDAAFNYENAWKYGGKANPAIGYKLAFNYLKAKRFVDAIDVCHKVLKDHPNYPKIKKDILDKARMGLRP